MSEIQDQIAAVVWQHCIETGRPAAMHAIAEVTGLGDAVRSEWASVAHRMTASWYEFDQCYGGTALAPSLKALAERIRQDAATISDLRARVRVEAADIIRTGVRRAHAEAWLRAQGWSPTGEMSRGVWTSDYWRSVTRDVRAVTVERSGDIGALAETVRDCAYHFGRPDLDILDEMAAMEVQP